MSICKPRAKNCFEFLVLKYKIDFCLFGGGTLISVQWAYVSDLQKQCAALQGGGIGSLDVDTNICADSYDAAAVAAGAACRAVDRVAAAPPGPRRVFVAVRPPGHHAGPWGRVSGPQGDASSSQGFCLLNSVAIAAAYARYTYRGLLDKIAIVDFDVHYGDGTAACVLNLLPGTHQTDVGHGLRISMPSYKPWLDDTDPDKVTSFVYVFYPPSLRAWYSPCARAHTADEE